MQSGNIKLPELKDGWIIGSDGFAQKIRRLVSPASQEPMVVRVRDQPPLSIADVRDAVMREFAISADVLSRKSSRHPARRVFAYLAKELSTATLRDIANVLGLSGSDSVHKSIQQFAKNQSEEDVRHRARIQNKLLAH